MRLYFVQRGGSDRFKKIQKNSGCLNGSLIEPQKKRNVLSQSFSFSSKGSLANNLHKSTTSLKQSKVASSITNGLISLFCIQLFQIITSSMC